MPLRYARTLAFDEASGGPDLDLVESAIADFRSPHPYLLFDRRAIARIRQRAARNPKLLARLEASLRSPGAAPVEEELRTRIKRQARRLIHTSFLALIGVGPTREDALRASRNALSGFAAEPSWKARPVIKSFLDCAEIAVAVSLAYDWLYGELSSEGRRAIEEALLHHVLEPALAAYNDRFVQWPKRRDNCTLVSNAGILVSALAVLKLHPQPAAQLIRNSIASSSRIFEALAPDGAWPEGLSYWSLAMRYAGIMVAALESTFSHGFGLAERPGFAQTGDFALHAAGPFGAAFNFGDSEPCFDLSPLAWFAHRFKRPVDARLIDRYDGWYSPFTAIWGDRPKSRHSAALPPTGKVFHSGNLACFRSTWSTDATARPVYLAIKGGNVFGNHAGSSLRPEDIIMHSQADAGSFVVDGARQRWIVDLGPDDYDLPGYFDHGADEQSGPRWRYYRTHAAGHNTLVINGHNQVPNARAPIIGHCVEGHRKWAIFDLSAAYGKPAGSIRRGAALIGKQVLIQDEVGPEILGSIVWTVHTSAEPVSVTGSLARFRLGEDWFSVRIIEPETAQFELGLPPEPRAFPIADVRQLHGHSELAGAGGQVSELPRRADAEDRRAAGALIRRLQIVWPRGTRRLCVLLVPDCKDDHLALPVRPLAEWLNERPARLARYPRLQLWVGRARAAKSRSAPELRRLDPAILRNNAPERIGYA